jgi:hypothetical protein
MQIFHSYGPSGMGDFVASTSFFLRFKLKEDSHIVFHIPKENRGYEQRITSVIKMFEDAPYNLTYEFDNSGSAGVGYDDGAGLSSKHCVSSFADFYKNPNKNKYKFIYRHDSASTEHQYWPSKTKWEANQNGPIGIYLNHEYQEIEVGSKFFNEQDNLFLHSLIDNHNYFSLGQPRSFEENVDIMSKCRYVIGLEGGWTHVSHSMGVPYIICANQRPLNEIKKFHPKHPNLQIIDTQNMRDFLVL